jgi:glucose/arabinose dehydrogenase
MMAMVRRISALLLLVPAGAAAALAVEQPPGQRFQLGPDDLPPPHATPSTANSPERVARPPGVPLRAPPGFKVNLFAEGLSHPRWMAVASNGDVFLAEAHVGRITLLRDRDGDGRSEARGIFAEGFAMPHGLAIRPDFLYVADTRAVWRLPYRVGDLRPAGPAQRVTAPGALGDGSGHWTRNIVFSRDGTRFFVAIGARDNIAEEASPRATVQVFNADGSSQRSFATGLRNAVGIAFRPGSDDLYVVVNERDGMGDGLVPDYLTRLRAGAFYGWPYAYIGPNPQPGFADRRPDLVRRTVVPDLLFHSHSAPIGLVFYDGTQFPAEYRGDAFVALQGSWNSAKPVGHMVIRVPFRAGRPVGYYETFVSGFWVAGEETAQVWGTPAGLAIAKDGSLLIADDTGRTIWRVSYEP